jgi:hypothetical protein
MGRKFESQSYWVQLGIADSDELESRIKVIFDQSDNREHVMVGLYRMIFPQWDRIAMISGFPEVGIELWALIFLLFREFDRKHHPDRIPGEVWSEVGFEENRNLQPWEIRFESCTIEYFICWQEAARDFYPNIENAL